MQFPKSKQVKQFGRKKKAQKIDCDPESVVQGQTNGLLDQTDSIYFRIPDTMNGKQIRAAMCGFPDTQVLEPLCADIQIAFCLELKKVGGETHGEQRRLAKALRYAVCTDINDVAKRLMRFRAIAHELREYLSKKEYCMEKAIEKNTREKFDVLLKDVETKNRIINDLSERVRLLETQIKDFIERSSK